MTFDYAKTAATAQRLLTRFGASTTLTHITAGTYNPDTGTNTPTEVAQTVVAALFPFGHSMVDGTLILATDQQAYIGVKTTAGAAVTEPKPGAVLTWGGRGLTVINAKNLGPAGTMVLFELQVRAQ
jgi:hypothetical protein